VLPLRPHNIATEYQGRRRGGGATGAFSPRPHLSKGVSATLSTEIKFSNRTVTLMQQSGRYSVDN